MSDAGHGIEVPLGGRLCDGLAARGGAEHTHHDRASANHHLHRDPPCALLDGSLAAENGTRAGPMMANVR